MIAPFFFEYCRRILDDLDKVRCLMFRWPKTGRERPWLFCVNGSAIEWRPKVFVTLNESQALVDAARANIGIVQVPSYMADEAIKRKELVELLQDIRPDPVPINAIYASHHNVPMRTRVLIDFLATLPGPSHAAPPRARNVAS